MVSSILTTPSPTGTRRIGDVLSSRWLGYVFDQNASAVALEGMSGNGDSGGPVLIEADGQWQLAGLTAWTYWKGDIAGYRAGAYGLTSYNVRLSNYAEWMERVMAPDASSKGGSSAPATGG